MEGRAHDLEKLLRPVAVILHFDAARYKLCARFLCLCKHRDPFVVAFSTA